MFKGKISLNGLFVVIINIIVFLGWIHLAAHFGKWWIALFCWVGMMSYKSGDNTQNQTPILSTENETE